MACRRARAPPGFQLQALVWVLGKGSSCTEYVLLFDQAKVLRAWKERACYVGWQAALLAS